MDNDHFASFGKNAPQTKTANSVFMNSTEDKIARLVSPCGLFCGQCHRYRKEKCPGCLANDKATWCKIRLCTKEKGYATCAECEEYHDVNMCKKFNNIFSKMFALIFKSDRKASLHRIAEIGIANYALEMQNKKTTVIKR